TLAIDGTDGRLALGTVLPALSAWHRRRQSELIVDSWRYRVAWQPIAPAPDRPLTGTWLVVSSTGVAPELVETFAGWVAAAGARPLPLPIDPTRIDRPGLARLLAEAVGGPAGGVLSFLALDERPIQPAVSRGLAGTLLLTQACAEASIGPLWCVTRGGVSTSDGEPVSPVQAEIWGFGRVAALELPRKWG